MLTAAHAIAEFKDGRVFPDRLTRKTHAHYLDRAANLLDLYRHGPGHSRQDLHSQARALFYNDAGCPLRRIAAFCKLLDDASAFDRTAGRRAPNLRQRVFRRAAMFHPLVRHRDSLFEHEELSVKRQIAEELGLSWPEIERELFADVIEQQRLISFTADWTPEQFLSRYNVAQTQATLYGAVVITVTTTADFKTILRYAKFARLLHTITRDGPGRYTFSFTGPASILDETRRYGVNFAKFLPALLSCRGWKLTAHIRPPWRSLTSGQRLFLLELTERDGLRSHLPPPATFDSTVEERLATDWGQGPRDGWQLLREGEILISRQHVFTPDFVLQHADGRRILLEIIGFWTPQYLETKRKTLELFHGAPLLLAAAAQTSAQMPQLPFPTIIYKTAIPVKDVLAALAAL